jgi:hypothetical protein
LCVCFGGGIKSILELSSQFGRKKKKRKKKGEKKEEKGRKKSK